MLAAYLILGITFSNDHRSIDAIEFARGMPDCMRAVTGMKLQIATRPVSEQSRLTFDPYCTDTKPDWWRD